MFHRFALPAAALVLAVSLSAASASQAASYEDANESSYIQCVPYARQVSGIELYGDAWTWWDQAEGRYERGYRPQVGAVMAFRPHGSMELGHVAAVSRVIDSRTVLLRHANWSPIDGRRGQIEDDVAAVDVSPANDWSQVRVWYDPVQDLGRTVWPIAGFIYNRPADNVRRDPRRERVDDWVIAPNGTIATIRGDSSPAARFGYSDRSR